MEEPTPHDNEEAESSSTMPIQPEIGKKISPRIFVASLSDYNGGLLHGEWIEANAEVDVIETAIAEMLERAPSGDAEEFAIFDFEGFGPWHPDEHEPIATVAVVAQRIAYYGIAFAHWYELVDTNKVEDIDEFEDVYLGHWATVEEYAHELIDENRLFREHVIDDSLSQYVTFDFQRFVEDLELLGDIEVSEGEGGVYVFEGHR